MSSVVRLYPNGLTAGVPPRHAPKNPAKRSTVGGWSHKSIRSNQRFLFSVLTDQLSGNAWSFTFTVGLCPPTADEWKRVRGVFFQHCRRDDLWRLHWLTEWQRRMVPHLHGCAFFDPAGAACARRLIEAWMTAAAEYAPKVQAQAVMPLYDAVGWFGYVSKHAARGLRHYQRSPELIPPGWLGRTGRMWGTLGDWPTHEGTPLDLDMPAFHALRRLIRQRRLVDARSQGDRRRIKHARRMLKCSDPKRSAVRGFSDWSDLSDSLSLVSAVGALGHQIRS